MGCGGFYDVRDFVFTIVVLRGLARFRSMFNFILSTVNLCNYVDKDAIIYVNIENNRIINYI